MHFKRIVCLALAWVLAIGASGARVHAAEEETAVLTDFSLYGVTRATESFNITVAPKTKAQANTSFPMAAGETITIKASYAPFSASVDFGVVDSDGVYHYFNATNGSIDKTMEIEESGDYTFQVRNNSNVEIKASGFVNY